jgi:hypothetical protein
MKPESQTQSLFDTASDQTRCRMMDPELPVMNTVFHRLSIHATGHTVADSRHAYTNKTAPHQNTYPKCGSLFFPLRQRDSVTDFD